MNEIYFMMSMRFNKKVPEDFGLMSSNDPDIYILPTNNSLWKKRNLYDFGWGKENGYYRIPLPEFDDLVAIMLNSDCMDNKYGAASIIIDDYGDELLKKCQEILKNKTDIKAYSEFFKILHLETPINRSTILRKSYTAISEDFEKWKNVSEEVAKYTK